MNGLELVKWVDSYGATPTWTDVDDLGATLLTCNSVGWVKYEDEDVLVIVPHVADETDHTLDQGCGQMTIPKCAVKERLKLTVSS